jgi:hypothetical protein
MLLSKYAYCPNCNAKVEKTKIRIVETAVGTRITCCEKCISYIKLRKRAD